MKDRTFENIHVLRIMIPSWVVFHYILNLNEILNTVLPEGQGLT